MNNWLQKIGPIAFMLLLLAACNEQESNTPGAKKGASSAIFADYRINAEEGKEQVTCLLQFYEHGPEGNTLLLQPPASVRIDGEAPVVDSALRTGAYYELLKPLETFAGRHTIVLTDEHGQQYSEEIQFTPLVLQTPLGGRVKKDSLVLQLGGVQPGEKVRVLLTDISFDTDDINRVQPVTDGRLVLTAEDLRPLAPGPVTLMLYKEVERPLQRATAAGGRLSLTYSLSRELELVE